MVAVLLSGVGIGIGIGIGVGVGIGVGIGGGVGVGVGIGIGVGVGVGATVISSVRSTSLRSLISFVHATTAVKIINVTNVCAIVDFN